MTLLSFDEALAYMQGLRRFGIKLGNERFEALLARVGNPHRRYRIVHITGTKGKGSTTAMAAAILREHGYRVGGYFSPYVYDVRERVQVDGAMIPHEAFARLVSELRPHVEALGATELGQTTEFELKTAVGFLYFAEREVDFAAVEVGIGGRLDATNVVSPVSTVITNVGLDHTHILGDTHAKIAFEKAGIIKPGVPCITAVDDPDALEVVEGTAAERAAPLYRVLPMAECERGRQGDKETGRQGYQHPIPNTQYPILYAADPDGSFTIRTPGREYAGLRSGLLGEYQRVNAACAVGAVEAALESVGREPDVGAVRRGLAEVRLPGRMQVVHRRPTVLLDGAHNEMAAQALAAEVARIPHDRLLLVVGMVAGHAPEGVLAALAPRAAAVYATQPTWNKAQPAEEIAAEARRHCKPGVPVRALTPPLAAARAALQDARPGDLVLVTGSFYVVGDVRPEELLAE